MGFKNFTLVLLAVTLLWQEGSSDGMVSVRLVKYTNPKGKGNNGVCCDGIGGLLGSICTGECDHFFQICLDRPSSTSSSVTVCPLGTYTTDQTREMNAITFGSTIGSTPNPKALSFRGAWLGGVKIKVNVLDFDTRNDNDFVEFLSKSHTQAANGAESSISIRGRTTLELRLSVRCSADFYGADCTTHCVKGRHYTCNPSTGVKECTPGWGGPRCDQDVDDCASSPCAANAGNCTDRFNGYRCDCFLGFSGDRCERGSPCVCDNGGTCYLDGNELACQCTEGFVGDDCEIPVPKAPAAESDVIVKFGEKLSQAEVMTFYERIDVAAANSLGVHHENISIYHREFDCEEKDTHFTLMTVDLYTADNRHFNESTALSVMKTVSADVQGTKQAFEYTELTSDKCTLVDVTGDDDDVSAKKKSSKKWLLWVILGVCLIILVVVVGGVLCFRYCL